MSLNWSVENVRDHEALHESDQEWAITNSLIWETMIIGLNEITEENVDEWVERIRIADAVQDIEATLYRVGDDGQKEPVPFTREILERRIGMHTNADNLTPAGFFKKLKGMHEDHLCDVRSWRERGIA